MSARTSKLKKKQQPAQINPQAARPTDAIIQTLNFKPGDALVASFPSGLSEAEAKARYSTLSSWLQANGFGPVPLLVVGAGSVLQILRREDVERALSKIETDRKATATAANSPMVGGVGTPAPAAA